MADQTAKKNKRQVKNPETFRERAVKATEAGGKPKRSAKVKQAGSRATAPVSGAAKKLSRAKALKPLRKPAKLLGRVLLPAYFRNSWIELKQVKWPGRRESIRLTFAVAVFATIFGVVIAGVDYGLDKLFKHLILN